ncbi:hypothetical protein Trydic_g3044 [Trypoxylus dichotomus]
MELKQSNRSRYSATNPPNYYWRDYVDGRIPCDALQGPNGKFIGQVYYGEQILPADVCPIKQLAIAERCGKQIVDENIKILCTPNPEAFIWQPIDFDSVTEDEMKNVIKGGSQDGYDLFIGKAFHEGDWKIGKVVPRTNPYKGLQVWNEYDACAIIRNFHILKFSNKDYPVVCYC